MTSAVVNATPRAEHVPSPGRRALAHLPGPRFQGALRIWNTIKILADPIGETQRSVDSWGPVFVSNSFEGWSVQLTGPDANELVLANRDRVFSSMLGWDPVIGQLFPRGLMLLDFDEHQLYRRALSVAFRPEPMARYLAEMNEGIARGLSAWDSSREMQFYPAIKQLTLDLAATSFLGIEWGPEAAQINSAFVDMMAAAIGLVRRPWPGTAMARGVRGRALLSAFFKREIAKRRGSSGTDIFTQLCNIDGDAGPPLTEQAIIDHMNFLMLAAHDTLTSSLCSTVYFLGRHPEWQERVRDEIDKLRESNGPTLTYSHLDELPLAEMVFKEALRLLPPVPAIPRRALADFEFQGHRIPAGTQIGISPLYTHRMPEIWPDPERFDPLRFSAEATRLRHRFAWVPFSSGAHMCIGIQFAYVQAKAFLFKLLSERRIVLEPGYDPTFRLFPMPRPKDGLRVRLVRRDEKARA